ncbi:MAG: Uma2 family endonuclease [Desulfobacterales bacterium]|nr:Uma2 family endonuclease [Desulfobacterales bacterium]
MSTATLQSVSENAWPEQGQWTYDDYLELPEDGCRYEIIEGVLYMTNAPDIDHQFTVVKIVSKIEHFVTENKLGYVLTAPFEVHLSEKSKPVQPDVLFISAEKWPEPGSKYYDGAPDLVVEVLSPSTRRTDQVVKYMAYEKAGVGEYWIVNPKTHQVQVFTLGRKEYVLAGEFAGDDVIDSKVLAGLEITAGSLFNMASRR